jgi:hypothetical protein
MKYTSMRPLAELVEDHEYSLLRYAVLEKVIPIFRIELENWKDKTFNIKTANAIAEAIKTACPDLEVYTYKGTNYKGDTFYEVSVLYYKDGKTFKEKFSNEYPGIESTPYLQFSTLLNRFNDLGTWITETEAKLAALPARHAEATKRLKALEDYEDLIS